MGTKTVVDISPPIPCLAELWFLWAKMLSANQIAGFFKVISQERSEWWRLFLAWIETSNSSSSLHYHFGCVQPGMSKVPKIRILHIFEVDFLPTNKHESFLQADTITFGFV